MHRQKGFTLVELLVALLVFSVGILGLAGLHTIALNNARKSYYNSLAIGSISNMVNAVLANLVGAKASNYHAPAATANANCYSSTGCSASSMASNDFYEWKTRVENLLPSGTVSICIDQNASSACDGVIANGLIHYVLRITWLDDGQTQAFEFPLKIKQ